MTDFLERWWCPPFKGLAEWKLDVGKNDDASRGPVGGCSADEMERTEAVVSRAIIPLQTVVPSFPNPGL